MTQHLRARLPDLIGAGITILLGLFALIQGRSYEIGTLQDMGPGYFPRLLAIALIVLGALLALVALQSEPAEFGSDRPAMKSVLLISASLLVFALLIERSGLIPAIFASVFLSTFASDKRNIPQALLLSAATALICAAVFVLGLGLPFKVFEL